MLAAVIGADLRPLSQRTHPSARWLSTAGQGSSDGVTGAVSDLIANVGDTVRFGIDALRAELGFPYRDATDVDGSHYLHGAASVTWTPDPRWELKASARVDGYFQTGDPDFSVGQLDYGESYVRYRGDSTRVTLGPQVILWGRIDEMAPTDRLSVVDLSRFWLDDLDERRRAVTALRVRAVLRRLQGRPGLDPALPGRRDAGGRQPLEHLRPAARADHEHPVGPLAVRAWSNRAASTRTSPPTGSSACASGVRRAGSTMR